MSVKWEASDWVGMAFVVGLFSIFIAFVIMLAYVGIVEGAYESRAPRPSYFTFYGWTFSGIFFPMAIWFLIDDEQWRRRNLRIAARQEREAKDRAVGGAGERAARAAAGATARAVQEQQRQKEELQRQVAEAEGQVLYAWLDFQARHSFLGEVPVERLAADFRATLPTLIPPEGATLLRFSATSQPVRNLLGMEPPRMLTSFPGAWTASPSRPSS